MLHPVGSQPPTIYWRRRLLVLASIALLIVLIALTARTILGGGSGEQAAAGTGTSGQRGAPHQTGGAATTPAAGQHAGTSEGRRQSPSGGATRAAAGGSTGSSTGAPTSGAALAKCTPGQLAVKAVVGKRRYVVGDQPVLTLQVTNTGPRPCVQDVADSQILLRVYNGASRVWGSHDCQIEPGVDERTLAVGTPASFSIVWSGLTSERKCAGTRQRVGAGTYTLYASLSGHEGKAAQFVIS